jgi:acetyl-CoA/propionyl-CoA carboxylase biotin carboxyl carrier protein
MTDQLFDAVLVANRGEIARRVIRTLRRLGIRSVAVYSDADAGAPHVREADAAYRVGPAAATASYLNAEAIIRAARESGAEAIHPGYGFLSENAAFARACADAGIVFIGPGERALDVMGDKIRSKAHVRGHGVPTVPGFSAVGLTDADISAAAEATGYPLLIKPSAGGGGKGMQIVRTATDLPEALSAARRVAMSSFGDDALLLERLIEQPRHIEVQILADAHGSVIHLGERECTLQRRHQKVIEEAPSPIVDAATRARLGVAACAAAASVDYRGAGTVEFLVAGDATSEFFFIEMNTRLQVEHPVTELVTGLDLVEQQLRIAAGHALGIAQHDVRLDGHAIEARVYAESPARGFLPSIGTVLEWSGSADTRTDAAVETGSVVSADYDPMIAKVIAHAPDRAEALRRLDRALADTVVLGIDTNIAFLRQLLADPAVRAGDLDTGLIDRLPPFVDPPPSPKALELAAAASVGSSVPNRPREASEDGFGADETRLRTSMASQLWTSGSGWRAGAPAVPSRAWFAAEDGSILESSGPIRRPGVAERRSGADEAGRAGADDTHVVRDADGTVWVHADGMSHRLTPLTRRAAMERRLAARTRTDAAAAPELRTPMPGTVVAVHVAEGAHVAAGDRLVTIEAMKMEQSVVAPHDGVATVAVAVGDLVARDEIVVTVRPIES